MLNFQSEKQLVLSLYDQLDHADIDSIEASYLQFMSTDCIWRGFYPFNELTAANAAREFWIPLRSSISSMQRRMDVFMAGQNMFSETPDVWVVSMGHLTGLMDKQWLGIPPTQKMIMLRYCEFHRVANGKITETAMYFDIPHLMLQCGLEPFPRQTAAHMVQPGPATHDGLLFDEQPPEEAQKTLDAINAMVRDLGQWQSGLELEDELARTWNDDMLWWGPAGIGSTYTIERYAKQHAGPFREAFSERTQTSHICRMAEGHFGGFFGWPNFTARLTGSFMGMPATQKVGEFRVIDIYRRGGDKLSENWIFIDLLLFWKQQGIDILAQTTTQQAMSGIR